MQLKQLSKEKYSIKKIISEKIMILKSDCQYSNMGSLHTKDMFLGNLLNFSVDQIPNS